MGGERVVPVHDGQSSGKALEAIVDLKIYVREPLQQWTINIDLPVLRNPFDPEESSLPVLPCRETSEEFENVNSAFSEQIHRSFDALAIYQAKETQEANECARWPSSDRLCLTIAVERQLIDHPLYCYHRNYHSSRLFARATNMLPQITCVTRFRVLSEWGHALTDDWQNVRPISARVPLELLTHLPSVRELECPWMWEYFPIGYPEEWMRHYSRPWEGPWRDARHDFGRAVQEINKSIPPSLTKARLWFYKIDSTKDVQGVPMPNLVHPIDADPVSIGIRLFATHLEELDVRAIITPDIFNNQEILWPRMKRLRVEFHPMRSDGSWYFVGPAGEDPHPQGFVIQDTDHYPPLIATEEDEYMDERNGDFSSDHFEAEEFHPDMFRTEPSAEKIEPLLRAFAQRLKATPSMEEAELFTYLTWRPSAEREEHYEEAQGTQPYEEGWRRWGVKYTAARDSVAAVVEWQVGGWRPATDVIELFQALGGGDAVDMTWKEFETEDRRWDPVDATM